MSTAVEALLIDRIKSLPVDQQCQVLEFVEGLSSEADDRSDILDRIDAITSRVPKEVRDNVPADGSLNVDHYLYGSPKKS